MNNPKALSSLWPAWSRSSGPWSVGDVPLEGVLKLFEEGPPWCAGAAGCWMGRASNQAGDEGPDGAPVEMSLAAMSDWKGQLTQYQWGVYGVLSGRALPQ